MNVPDTFLDDVLPWADALARGELRRLRAGGLPEMTEADRVRFIELFEAISERADELRLEIPNRAAEQSCSKAFTVGLSLGRFLGLYGELPDASRGRKTIAAAAEGGRTRRKGPTNEELCEAVRVKRKELNTGWSRTCELVGKDFGLSRSTVSTRAKAADWRNPR